MSRRKDEAAGVPLPLPRPSLALPLLALLALTLPSVAAAPSVEGAVHGTGTASGYRLFTSPGWSVGGGVAEWTTVCGDCLFRVTFTQVAIVVVENGEARQLEPGTYEFRHFAGVITTTYRAPYVHDVRIEGVGSVEEVA